MRAPLARRFPRKRPIMLVAQFVFGLLLIVAALAVLATVLSLVAWVILSVVRSLPLVGRKHRHSQWDELNRPGGPTE